MWFNIEKYKRVYERIKCFFVKKYSRFLVLKHLKFVHDPCVLCGSNKWSMVRDGDRYDLPIKTQRCVNCGLVSVHPMPSKSFLDWFYSSAVYRGLYKGYLKADKNFVVMDKSIERAHQRISFVNTRIPILENIKILDYGCPEGTFLHEFKKSHNSAKTYGIEPGMSFSSFRKDDTDGMFESVHGMNPELRLNIITMWHVLEHVREPVQVLVDLRKKLDIAGCLIIEVPDFDTYMNIRKGYHIGHLFHFSKDTIVKIIKSAGFSSCIIYPADESTAMRIVARCS